MPYAAVLNFRADETTELAHVDSFDELLRALDGLRDTDISTS
ncbi:MAG: hypothetical protein QNM02_19270 [Acidimicrobiia bacterium]|nr:hypothetical protein [Acidimicrobiia bacterium]